MYEQAKTPSEIILEHYPEKFDKLTKTVRIFKRLSTLFCVIYAVT
jgi:hypothetical protein